jgi:hypothetical protein
LQVGGSPSAFKAPATAKYESDKVRSINSFRIFLNVLYVFGFPTSRILKQIGAEPGWTGEEVP